MRRATTFLFCILLALAGCGGGDGGGGGSSGGSAPVYSVGGTVSGLSGSGLTLTSGADTLNITGNGSFVLPTKLASGASYNVTVSAQPRNPAQVCAVQNGAGTVTSADVTAISVICTTSPSTYAYAAVPRSAADQSIGLIQYFAFDPATGRLSLQGSIAAAASTEVLDVTAAPSGIQLLVTTRTLLGYVGRNPDYRTELVLYDLSPTSGAPSPSRLVSSPALGGDLIFHPNGIDFYRALGPGRISTVYHYSLASGAAQGQSLELGPQGGTSSAISPDGKFLFVPAADSLNNANAKSFIAVVSLANPLEPQLASKVPIPNEPFTATISADGRLLYVTVNLIPAAPGPATGVGYVYNVSPSGGLTQSGSFSTPADPRSAVITPSGNFLYVASFPDNKLQGYRLDGTGGVTPLNSGTTVPFPSRLVLDPDGKFLYVVSGPNDGSQPAIYGFAIGTDGALTPVPGSPFANGERASNLTFARANP